MAGTLLYPGNILSLTTEAADRLLAAGSGDAALIYLYLLRHGGTLEPQKAARDLRWTPDRLTAAFQTLLDLKLAAASAQTAPPAAPPEPDSPPDYTTSDITQELENKSSTFPGLLREVERRLGKKLSTSDLKMLYTLYDYLSLPAEVIMLLVSYCAEEYSRKYGPGRVPRLSQIQREGFVWKRLGVDTMEAAEEHLKKVAQLRERGRSILALMGIRDRDPVDQERRYIASWVEMGFEDPAIRLAYERTVLQKQKLNWPYMNSILKRWHQSGLHTVAAIQAGDSGPRPVTAPAPGNVPHTPGEADRRTRENLERLRLALQKEKGEN